MATPSDLQGAASTQQNQSDSTVLGGSTPVLQNPGGPAVLNTTPTALVVVGEQQPNPNHFPTTEVTVLIVILIVSIIGTALWFKD